MPSELPMPHDLVPRLMGTGGGVQVFVDKLAPKTRNRDGKDERIIVHFDDDKLMVHPDNWDEFVDTVNITLAIAEPETKPTLPPRIPIRIVDSSQIPPHEFVRGEGVVRIPGAPMRNPPQPSDTMQDPTCKVCRRYPNDKIHAIKTEA